MYCTRRLDNPKPIFNTALFAGLHNAAALSLHELNDLKSCRDHLSITRKIREAVADLGDLNLREELAFVYHNTGLVESAAGQPDEALVYFDSAQRVRNCVKGGHSL